MQAPAPTVRASVRIARVGAEVAWLSWSAPVLLLLGALWVAALPTVACSRRGDGAVRCTLTGRGLLRPDLPISHVEAPPRAADEEGPRLVVFHPGHPPSYLDVRAARAAEVAAWVQGFAARGLQRGEMRAGAIEAAAALFLGATAVVMSLLMLRQPRGYQLKLLEGDAVELEVERVVGRSVVHRFPLRSMQSVSVEDIDDSALQKLVVVREGVSSELCRGVSADIGRAEMLLRGARADV